MVEIKLAYDYDTIYVISTGCCGRPKAIYRWSPRGEIFLISLLRNGLASYETRANPSDRWWSVFGKFPSGRNQDEGCNGRVAGNKRSVPFALETVSSPSKLGYRRLRMLAIKFINASLFRTVRYNRRPRRFVFHFRRTKLYLGDVYAWALIDQILINYQTAGARGREKWIFLEFSNA